MSTLTSKKYDGVSGVHEHIIEMNNIAKQLKSMERLISESFLVHFILNSLSLQFGPFKTNHNAQKNKWTISQLISMCVQEEDRLKNEGLHTVHMVSQGHKENKPKKTKRKGQRAPNKGTSTHNGSGGRCHFCKRKGHFQKDCLKRKAWFQKKGNFLSYVCFETNLVDVPSNTWWLDCGATIHVSNNM